MLEEALARLATGITSDLVSQPTLDWARHALLDCLACGVAGAAAPLAEPVIGIHALDKEGSSILGTRHRLAPMDAALVNGTLAHALDFDDVNSRGVGHPSVAIVPAILALAEVRQSSGMDFLLAKVAGHEVFAQIGDRYGRANYDAGFHCTGTIGAFAAAVSCTRLIGLDVAQTRTALSLAATQASGLKAMFGTMAKPLNAGLAAQAGLRAALLAEAGFTAPPETIEAPQGFAETQSRPLDRDLPVPSAADVAQAGFAVEQTLFKFNASCYVTQPTIEATRTLRSKYGLRLEDLDRAVIHAPAAVRRICDNTAPQSGLDMKFSVRQMLLLTLDGRNTGDPNLFTDECACDARYTDRIGTVSLKPQDFPNNKFARVELFLRDGRVLDEIGDMDRPATNLAEQWTKLSAKARALTDPVLGQGSSAALIEAVEQLETETTLKKLTEAVT